jgi:uroporphyrin-III C-methyltransferase
MKKQVYPKITLVGAGPGDPELFTLKGISSLNAADVVLYDALVNEALLIYIPESAIKIYVGKRAGNHQLSQEQINHLMVDMALSYGHVVRLKGGDPFVFGRGHEELTFAKYFNIETSVVPGISSAVAVPELQQIPLTKRGISESFWVLTGTTKAGTISPDLELAAQSSATIVILMGMKNLPEIAAVFQKHSKGDLAVAIIQNGSLPEERYILSTMDDVCALALQEKIGSPAIIIIGDVVKEHPDYVYDKLQENHFYNHLLIA